MVKATPEIKELYKEIQEKLFSMIPEKWDRIYLYASILEGINHLETGEMFFYYFPKGILKKDPVNVYEVPNKFNLDEQEYFQLADELYGVIKKLRKECEVVNGKKWGNLTISVENFQFKIEYDYQDLKESPYNSYERHLIWRYEYLEIGVNTYNRKDRKIIEEYRQNKPYRQEQKDTYIEGIYQVQKPRSIDYEKENSFRPTEKQDLASPILSIEEQIKQEQTKEEQRNQILNFNRKNIM